MNVDKCVEILMKEVAEKNFLDVGSGVERHFDMSRTMFDLALDHMESEGYGVQTIEICQFGTKNVTKIKVLTRLPIMVDDASTT